MTTEANVTTHAVPVALTIAGSDPSGGAGMQADLKTFQTHGVYGMSVVTLLTVQNTAGVEEVMMMEPSFVRRQFDCVIGDIPPTAAKTGALGSSSMIHTVGRMIGKLACPVVVDPVMITKHGVPIIDEDAVKTLRESLLPAASLITPNRHEAERLTGRTIRDEDQLAGVARSLLAMGPAAVLIKAGFGDRMIDFFQDHQSEQVFASERIVRGNTHGSGCVLSAAITSRLARGGPPAEAISQARESTRRAIASPRRLGKGISPAHLYP